MILIVIFSVNGFANDAVDIFNAYMQKAFSVSHAVFNVIDRVKYVGTDSFSEDTLYVLLKKNGFIPKINAYFRIQHANGNVELLNGSEFKSLDVEKKKLFVIDTADGAFKWIEMNGIPQLLRKPMPYRENMLEYPEFYSFNKFPNSVNISGLECSQISMVASLTAPVNREENDFGTVYPVYDSTVIAVANKDNMMRRFYRYVVFEDGGIQEEEQIFSNMILDLPIDLIMFDIQAPEGYLVEVYEPDKADANLLMVGAEAPIWVLGDDMDKEYRLSDYRGKVVMLVFWGSWCPWCAKAMPIIEDIHKKYGDLGLKVIGISCQEPNDANPRDYMRKNNYTFQLLVQGDNAAKDYNVTGFPTIYIVDKLGKISGVSVGYTDDMGLKLRELIQRELAK